MRYTVEKIKEEITEDDRSEMIRLMLDNEEAEWSSDPEMKELWVAWGWLNKKLDEHGKTDDEKRTIGIEFGRMSRGKRPYEVAAQQINKYVIDEYN